MSSFLKLGAATFFWTLVVIALAVAIFSNLAHAGVQVTHFSVASSQRTKAPMKQVTRAPAKQKTVKVLQQSVVDHVSFMDFESFACPPGRITSTRLGLRYDELKNKQMDITRFDNIMGYNEWTSPIQLWPWKQGFTLFKGWPRTPGAYGSAKYVVPTDRPAHQRTIGWGVESIPGPGIDVSISSTCGNFSPAARYCAESNSRGSGRLVSTKYPTSPVVAACVQVAGREYWYNWRLTNPQGVPTGDNCVANICQFGFQNNHTP